MLSKDLTPSIFKVRLPINFIFAPPDFKKFIKSIISGSIAQFLRMVIPFAKHAAIIVFSVAPTLIFENLIFAPLSFSFVCAWI